MDCGKIGTLILNLRKEKNMTQKELACAMNISDKTISKWERGLGCPDVSLLNELSTILEINVEKILLGDLHQNNNDGGNMKKIKFYICSNCGNVISSTTEAEVSCCSRKLVPLTVKPLDKLHEMKVTEVENDYYITFEHEMSKTHYISFAAYVSFDRILLIKLYPEQNAEIRFPKMYRGNLYFYCTQHGLRVNKL